MADEKNQDLFDLSKLQGDGNVEMVIFGHNGKIIQRFARPMLFVAFEPANMGEILNRFLGATKEAGATPVINMPRRTITREKRNALVTRATLVMKSMTEKGRAPAAIAQHVVDSILSAIE